MVPRYNFFLIGPFFLTGCLVSSDQMANSKVARRVFKLFSNTAINSLWVPGFMRAMPVKEVDLSGILSICTFIGTGETVSMASCLSYSDQYSGEGLIGIHRISTMRALAGPFKISWKKGRFDIKCQILIWFLRGMTPLKRSLRQTILLLCCNLNELANPWGLSSLSYLQIMAHFTSKTGCRYTNPFAWTYKLFKSYYIP